MRLLFSVAFGVANIVSAASRSCGSVRSWRRWERLICWPSYILVCGRASRSLPAEEDTPMRYNRVGFTPRVGAAQNLTGLYRLNSSVRDERTHPVINLDGALERLSVRRPIFHSEADFQHELAWQIRAMHPELAVRLERPFPGRTSGAIDIVASAGELRHAIELKYLSRSCELQLAGEDFRLKQHGAQDVRRYDVCKDVERMEDFCAGSSCSASVIVLTNDPYYWRVREPSGTCAAAFNICQNRELSGELGWAEHTGTGTKKNREKAIILRGSYRLDWRDYSDLKPRGGRFRYLHIRISHEGSPSQ